MYFVHGGNYDNTYGEVNLASHADVPRASSTIPSLKTSPKKEATKLIIPFTLF